MWKRVLFILLALMLVRHCLFHTETSWRFYLEHLQPEDIGVTGFREHDFLKEEVQHFSLPSDFPGVEYLAVGSSQTGFLYHKQSVKTPERLRVITVGGMSPFDFMLFRSRIEAYKPKNILLYLSELDMANEYYKPYLPNVRIAPPQGLSIVPIFWEMPVTSPFFSPAIQ